MQRAGHDLPAAVKDSEPAAVVPAYLDLWARRRDTGEAEEVRSDPGDRAVGLECQRSHVVAHAVFDRGGDHKGTQTSGAQVHLTDVVVGGRDVLYVGDVGTREMDEPVVIVLG